MANDSTYAGIHGGGAAYAALRLFGAVMGCGVGLRGQSYAIPTMQGGVDTIKPYVDDFIAFAKDHPEKFFSNFFGIFIGRDYKPERIVLKAAIENYGK